MSSEYCFEGIIGKSRSHSERAGTSLALLRQRMPPSCFTARRARARSWSHAPFTTSVPGARRSFVRMNCAAIPSGLLESELFGHERGAFTGALMQRKGRFELADGGSLFLDEIGDISLELQPKLLRAVQEQEFERLGSAKTIQVNVRIIAATHRDLSAMIREEKFREDLFLSTSTFFRLRSRLFGNVARTFRCW